MSNSSFEKALTAKPEFSGVSGHMVGETGANAANGLGVAGVAWLPIESAPKDGSIIDVWIDGEFPGRRTDVSWRKPTDSEWWVHGGDTIETPDATWHDDFGPLSSCEQPTHWMPLPPAPTPQEARHD